MYILGVDSISGSAIIIIIIGVYCGRKMVVRFPYLQQYELISMS